VNRFPVFIPALAPSSLAPRTPDTPLTLPPDDYHPNTLILICNAPLLLVSLKLCVGGGATTNCSCRALRSRPCRHGSCLQSCCALTGHSLMLGGRCTMRDGRLNVLIVKPKKQVCCVCPSAASGGAARSRIVVAVFSVQPGHGHECAD
jgi:hypothetical protein